jgi:predicted helicase
MSLNVPEALQEKGIELTSNTKEKIGQKTFAMLLARLCRKLRDRVKESLGEANSPLVPLAQEWRQPHSSGNTEESFEDAYAQTVTFALLLARSEGADPLTLENAEAVLSTQYKHLSRTLRVLADPEVSNEVTLSLDPLLHVISAVSAQSRPGSNDSWRYFYEDFLTAYDPELRGKAGAYYTPLEVIHAQVRLVDDLLRYRLGKLRGFAEPDVITLDPAAGTGAYLLGVIEHALDCVEAGQGSDAVPEMATTLASNLVGYEIMAGPCAVTEMSVSRLLQDRGAILPREGIHIFRADILGNPSPVRLPISPVPQPIIVCLGNPPYDRHEATNEQNHAYSGGWVRWGDEETGATPIFNDFRDPAIKAGHGVDVKNLYNLYVYFWRWALWRVFEQGASGGHGIVSFISASSYLSGDAFAGMREQMRRVCDEIWIIDLGGEGRGTRKTKNVFAIQSPVSIAVLLKSGKTTREKPARVRYARIEGTREEKLQQLDSIRSIKSLKWQSCPSDWQSPFRPAGVGDYFSWPLLTDLMPWQHTGCEIKRTWPICHDVETLKVRWQALLKASNRATAFRETRDRKTTSDCPPFFDAVDRPTPLGDLPRDTSPPRIQRYAYRSFDRQWVFADNRLGDYLRPDLWRSNGPKQVFFTSLFNHPLGGGPALTACGEIPDRHHLRGSYGGKDVLPLFRDSKGQNPNILPGLLDLLGKTYHHKVTPEDFAAYVYGLLAQPEFTKRYAEELETREIHVPLTKDEELFAQVRNAGARLLWMHTYGERFVPKGTQRGRIPNGSARCIQAVPGDPEGDPESFSYSEATRTLLVGSGEFRPVAKEVFDFEVSGLKVVQSWLKYRMKKGAGKKSSPLDDIRPEQWTIEFTDELLELLWVLEATMEGYPEQVCLLEAVVEGPCFEAEELPSVPEDCRKPLQPMANDHYYEDF